MNKFDPNQNTLNGLEATKAIGSYQDHNLLLLGVTANAMKEDRDVCLAARMNEYISKPIKTELLKESLPKAATRQALLK